MASIFIGPFSQIVSQANVIAFSGPTLTTAGTGPQSGFHWQMERSSLPSFTSPVFVRDGVSWTPQPLFDSSLFLNPSSTYYYRLTFHDPVSGVTSVSVIMPGVTAPAVGIGNLTAQFVGSTFSTITHPPATDGNPPSHFQWYRSATNGFTPGPGNILSGQTGVTLNDTGLSPSTNYYYVVEAIDDFDVTAYSPQLTILTPATLSISTPTAAQIGATVSQIVGTSASGGAGLVAYQWYRSTSGSGFTPGPSNILIGQTNLILNDSGLTPSTTYWYKLVATDAEPVTATSSAVSITTVSALTVATPALSSVNSNTASVSSSGASGGVIGSGYLYQWYRSIESGFSPSNETILNSQVLLTLLDSGLSPASTYYYVVQAIDSVGDVSKSAQLAVTTLPAALSIGSLLVNSVGPTSVSLTAPNATGGTPPYTYAWYKSLVAGSLGDLLVGQVSQTILDSGLSAGTQYFYTCVVTDSTSPVDVTANSLQTAITTTQEELLGDYYSNLLILQYSQQPNARETIKQLSLMATMPATSTQTSDAVLPLVVQNAFNIGSAQGVQLDVVGRYLGLSRNTVNPAGQAITLSDPEFTKLIQITAAARRTGTSLANIDTFIASNLPGEMFVIDHDNMTITYWINASSNSINVIDALIAEQVLPKPNGVRINYILSPSLNFFGFSSYGADGTWVPAAPLIQGFQTYTSYSLNSPWMDYANVI